MDQTFYITLSLIWFILYWLFGGVFFSVVALIRLGRIRKARFGCFFSLTALGTGLLAAWSGLSLAAPQIRGCVSSPDGYQLWLETFACGIAGIIGMFLAGFLLLIFVGFILLSLSKQEGPTWIEPSDELEDEADEEDE